MQQNQMRQARDIQAQQTLYHVYALAAEAYVRMPTLDNWEKKEKAFENYNALIRGKKDWI